MKSVSPAQMRALQLLREGKLVWGTAGQGLSDVSIEPASRWLLHPTTARILVDNGWVELKKFNPRRGEYRLTKTGQALTEELCHCVAAKRKNKGGRDAFEFILLSGISVDATTLNHDWANEPLLCRRCWRVASCEGKFFKQPHGANRYVWGIGPICQRHYLNPGARSE